MRWLSNSFYFLFTFDSFYSYLTVVSKYSIGKNREIIFVPRWLLNVTELLCMIYFAKGLLKTEK